MKHARFPHEAEGDRQTDRQTEQSRAEAKRTHCGSNRSQKVVAPNRSIPAQWRCSRYLACSLAPTLPNAFSRKKLSKLPAADGAS